MPILLFLSVLSDFERVFHRFLVPGQGQSPSVCMPTRRVDIQTRCLQFTVWRNFELLRTCQNRIFGFGMFVETGSDLEPQAPHLYPQSGCPGLQMRGLCPHLAWLSEPRRAVLSQKKPASRETGRAGGKIWATSRLSWPSGDAKSEVQARFSTLS